MRTRARVVVCLAAAIAGAAAAQQPARPDPAAESRADPPDTPAGRAAAGWLAAIGSGKRDAIRAFVATRFGKPPKGDLPVDPIADQFAGLAKATGGFAVAKVMASTPTSVTLFVRAKATGFGTELRVDVTAADPPVVTGLGLTAAEAPPELLPKSRLGEAEVRRRADALVTALAAADAFSGVVLVAKGGKPVYERAVGPASRAWGAKNRPDTRFNLASLQKMFTAVAVAQLADQGKLGYDDTLGTVLPDYPNKEAAGKIKVRHLLAHTAGLPPADATADRLLAAYRKGFRTAGEYLPGFAGERLGSEPGERFAYSNYGYLVLGLAVEKASGREYHAYLREHVFGPAGMTGTDGYELDADPPNLATGYLDAPGGRRSNVFHLAVRGTPFGGGYATAGDLVRFAEALRGGTLLKKEAVETLWKGQANDGRYGYGFEVRTYNGVRVVGHGGGWFGVTNHLDVYPDRGYAVVILSNYDAEVRPMALLFREWLAAGAD